MGGQQAPSRGFKGGSGNLELICLCLPYPTPRSASISCTCLWEEQRECWRGSCKQPAVSSTWRALLVACRPEPVRSGSKRSQQQHPQHCLPAFSCSIRLNLIHARSLKPTCTLVIIAMMRQARYKTMAKGKATTHPQRCRPAASQQWDGSKSSQSTRMSHAGRVFRKAHAPAHGRSSSSGWCGMCSLRRAAGGLLPQLIRGRQPWQQLQGGRLPGAGALGTKGEAAVPRVRHMQACTRGEQGRGGIARQDRRVRWVRWLHIFLVVAPPDDALTASQQAAHWPAHRSASPTHAHVAPEKSRQHSAQGTAVQMTMASPRASARCMSV